MGLLTSVLLPVFSAKTPWKFTTSGGGSLSAWIVAGTGGSVFLTNTSTGENGRLRYLAGGSTLGPAPVGGSISTVDMFSIGLGNIRAIRPDLPLSAMQGGIAILGLSVAGSAGPYFPPEGGSLSLYFFGISGPSALASLVMGPLVGLLNALTGALAFGMMAGQIKGADVGISLQTGYAL